MVWRDRPTGLWAVLVQPDKHMEKPMHYQRHRDQIVQQTSLLPEKKGIKGESDLRNPY